MSNNPKLKDLEDERREIVQRIRGLPFNEAWQEKGQFRTMQYSFTPFEFVTLFPAFRQWHWF